MDYFEYLASQPPGPVDGRNNVLSLLGQCWGEFHASRNESTTAAKLLRAEDVIWDPPNLRFTLERHGGTVLGSSRADLHRWSVDLEKRTAVIDSYSRRQVRPMDARWGADTVADELVKLILAGKTDGRLSWKSDGSVRVLIDKVLPVGGFKATRAGRSKRLREAIRSGVQSHGWMQIVRDRYRPSDKR